MSKLPKLLDQVREKLRVERDAIRAGQSYVARIKHDVHFDDKPHPKDLGAQDVGVFLTHLAVACKMSAPRAGAAWPFRCFHHHDLHPRTE